MSDWIEIFRTGDYGPKGRYDAAALDRLVENYNPAIHEAPLVIGHPEHDKPAYGWVEGLKRTGEVLFAKTKQINPALTDLLKQGAFKKRSVSLYADLAGKGPYLRHVGFLGAQAPEVKGLAELKFHEGEFKEIEFSEHSAIGDQRSAQNYPEGMMDSNEMKKTMRETIKEFFSELFGAKKDAGFSEEQLQTVAAKAATDAVATASVQFSEQLKAATTKITALETSLAEASQAGRLAGKQGKIVAFCEPLARSGQLPPAFANDGLVKFLETLDDASKSVCFGEDKEKQELTQLDFALAFLKKLPKIVPFGEIVTSKKENKGRTVVRFNEAAGSNVDPASIQLAEEAEALAVEQKISYGQALTQLKEARRAGRQSA